MRWTLRRGPRGEIDALVEALGVSTAAAKVLASRGFTDPAGARDYLEPALNNLHDPFELVSMGPAARLLHDAVEAGKRIVVFGDFDVDGLCGTAILLRVLRIFGADVVPVIPNRLTDGYSLTDSVVDRILAKKPDVVVTVDNGITAVEGAARIGEAGVDLVIVDHHEPARELPEARAILNPKLPDSGYPYRDLSATGVAFKLGWALCHLRPPGGDQAREVLLDCLGTVALATVADVAPLTGENRILVHYGLKAIQISRHPGIRALVDASRIRRDFLVARDLAFRLGPLMNAPGRIGDASVGLRLLTADTAEEAEECAKELAKANRKRQSIQRKVHREAKKQAAEHVEAGRAGLVLADPEWHPGVTGIVAGQLSRETRRPTILITIEEGRARGSCRSVGGMALPDALEACTDLLISHGGHARAAGVVLETKNLDAFRERFCEAVDGAAGGEEPVKTMEVDAEVRLDELVPPAVRELEQMAPFGEGNPQPLLASHGCRVVGTVRPGPRGKKSVAFFLRQGDVALGASMIDGDELRERMNGGGGTDLTVAYRPRFGREREVDLEVVAFPAASALEGRAP